MRAIECQAWGDIDNLALVDIPPPGQPGAGEVLIDVAAAGVNFADLLITAGKYQERPMPPFTPGFEVAGVIRALGPGVAKVKAGDRVLALLDRGGFAEQVIARAADCFILPAAMDFAT